MNSVNILLVAMDAVRTYMRTRNAEVLPRTIVGETETQTCVFSIIEDGKEKVFMATIQQLATKDHPVPKSRESASFWGGYSKGVAEACASIANALRRNNWNDIGELHRENANARPEIQAACKAVGAGELAEQMRVEDNAPNADDADYFGGSH